MAVLGGYTCNSGNATAFDQYSRLDTSATATGTVLDFAWNNPDTTFLNAEMSVTADTDNSTAYRRFHFNGTSQQLQSAFSDWSTATNTIEFTGGFGRLGKVRHALMQIFEEPSKEIKKQMSKKDKILICAK